MFSRHRKRSAPSSVSGLFELRVIGLIKDVCAHIHNNNKVYLLRDYCTIAVLSPVCLCLRVQHQLLNLLLLLTTQDVTQADGFIRVCFFSQPQVRLFTFKKGNMCCRQGSKFCTKWRKASSNRKSFVPICYFFFFSRISNLLEAKLCPPPPH